MPIAFALFDALFVGWALRTERGMQAGNKLYYDLKVETGDDTYTAARSLADFDVASGLARHWMTGGARAS